MVKVISLSNEAYERLKAIKRNRSFSEVVIEIVPKKRNIMEFFGAFKDNANYWKKFEKKVYTDRKKAKLGEYKL